MLHEKNYYETVKNEGYPVVEEGRHQMTRSDERKQNGIRGDDSKAEPERLRQVFRASPRRITLINYQLS